MPPIGSTGWRSYLSASGSFGATYGPFAGFIGILLWCYLASIAFYVGVAFAAQLEAARARISEVRSPEKIDAGESDARTIPYRAVLANASNTNGDHR